MPTPNRNIPCSNIYNVNIKRMQSSRSPLNLLKQDLSRQFSGVEFENELKNLGNVFDKCNKSELIEKFVKSKNISKNK